MPEQQPPPEAMKEMAAEQTPKPPLDKEKGVGPSDKMEGIIREYLPPSKVEAVLHPEITDEDRLEAQERLEKEIGMQIAWNLHEGKVDREQELRSRLANIDQEIEEQALRTKRHKLFAEARSHMHEQAGQLLDTITKSIDQGETVSIPELLDEHDPNRVELSPRQRRFFEAMDQKLSERHLRANQAKSTAELLTFFKHTDMPDDEQAALIGKKLYSLATGNKHGTDIEPHGTITVKENLYAIELWMSDARDLNRLYSPDSIIAQDRDNPISGGFLLQNCAGLEDASLIVVYDGPNRSGSPDISSSHEKNHLINDIVGLSKKETGLSDAEHGYRRSTYNQHENMKDIEYQFAEDHEIQPDDKELLSDYQMQLDSLQEIYLDRIKDELIAELNARNSLERLPSLLLRRERHPDTQYDWWSKDFDDKQDRLQHLPDKLAQMVENTRNAYEHKVRINAKAAEMIQATLEYAYPDQNEWAKRIAAFDSILHSTDLDQWDTRLREEFQAEIAMCDLYETFGRHAEMLATTPESEPLVTREQAILYGIHKDIESGIDPSTALKSRIGEIKELKEQGKVLMSKHKPESSS